MNKIVNVVVMGTVIMAAGVFCSGEIIGKIGDTSANNDSSEIWSSQEVAYKSINQKDSGIYTMQGSDVDSQIDYNTSMPINPKDIDFTTELDNNMSKLDVAMEESAEIMRSINIQSTQCLEDGAIALPKNSDMNIDEFEMQRIEPQNKNISNNLSDQVIAEVGISFPSRKFNTDGIIGMDNRRSLGTISSATMKVVDVLLKYGEEDRALSMIENALFGDELN